MNLLTKGQKRFLALMLAMVLCLSSLAGCGSGSGSSSGGSSSSGSSSGSAGGTESAGTGSADSASADAGRTDLNFAVASEPNSLDPMAIATMATFTITYAIYDNLVEEDGEGGYVCLLAEDYEVSDDELVYTFHLRQDVTFHDGTPMTADDVVYSINRTIEKGWAADMTAAIDHVEKVDDYTVTLNLAYPFGGMIGSLASPYFSIMSEAYAQENGEDAVERTPMGTGAYKFVEWVSGDHILVEANEDYFAGAPSIKTITFRPITDKNTGLIALQAGEADAFLNVNYSDIGIVEGDDSLAYYSTDLAAVLSLNMNVEVEPLDNELVRQAINYAINRQNIIDGALEGYGTIANSAISPTCDGYSDQVTGYGNDVEKAKELLAQAGYDSLDLKLKIKEDSKYQKVATIIQNDLRAANINVDIEILEAGAYSTDIYSKGDYELTLVAWCAMFTDAYSLLYSQFHKDCYGGTGNITHVMSDELSSMLENAAELTGEAKTAAYEEIAQYLNDHAYVACLVYEPTSITVNANLDGIKANTLGIYKVKNFSWK